MQYVERIKNEIYQRRIPNRTGGGANVIDASYNPISINEDFFLATNADGKGSKVEQLGGGENLGQIDDLKYFNNKMIRGLGVPSSYLPTGPEDGTAVYNDGQVGAAFVQEYRFSKYCQRLQNLMAPILDKEFKLFLKNRGIEIQSNLFEVQFCPPQSFSQYRQMKMDGEQIQLFSGLMSTEANRYISKRFALERYLGWTKEEIADNERMWREENADAVRKKTGAASMGEAPGISSIGIRPEPDLGDMGIEPEPGEGEEGAENATGGAAPPVSGGGAAAAPGAAAGAPPSA
jgi:hypothetical protein